MAALSKVKNNSSRASKDDGLDKFINAYKSRCSNNLIAWKLCKKGITIAIDDFALVLAL